MVKKKKKLKIPVCCKQCVHIKCYMKKKYKHNLTSQYYCGINNNQVSMHPLKLIPKWCPEKYKNIFDN